LTKSDNTTDPCTGGFHELLAAQLDGHLGRQWAEVLLLTAHSARAQARELEEGLLQQEWGRLGPVAV